MINPEFFPAGGEDDELSITVNDVSKSYKIWETPFSRLKAPFLEKIGALTGNNALLKKAASYCRTFDALKGVSFEARKGESIAIIGLNGSGKSTLLQILAHTLTPTSGSAWTRGKIAALLELGSGFNPEFTGRENVYLNASILGISRREMEGRFEAVLDFAEIAEFIDQPVKTYSSGMVVRLAFAVLTQVEPDILIVDEALSVGDFLFQQKCYDCLREFRRRGCTFLFVSHNMGSVLDLCGRALLLEKGVLTFDGQPREAVDLYESHAMKDRFKNASSLRIVRPESSLRREVAPPFSGRTANSETEPPASAPGELGRLAVSEEDEPSHMENTGSITTSDVDIEFVRIFNEEGVERDLLVCGEKVGLAVGVLCKRELQDPHIGFRIRNRHGVILYETNTYCMRSFFGAVRNNELIVAEFAFDMALAEGEYSITTGVANTGRNDGDFEEALLFKHAAKAFVVVKNRSAFGWCGIMDLKPQVKVSVQGPSLCKEVIA